MTYEEFMSRESFSQEELIAYSYGRLVEDVPLGTVGMLPAPPFLMFDRITSITRGHRGRMLAELDVRLDAWYFQCHFTADPVQPGCLGLDAIWQLLGFYLGLCGARGVGRALGCNEVEFFGQIRPHNKLVTYDIEVRRVMHLKNTGASLIVGDGTVLVDHEPIYTARGARVGYFIGIRYPDYPMRSVNSIGGQIRQREMEAES